MNPRSGTVVYTDLIDDVIRVVKGARKFFFEPIQVLNKGNNPVTNIDLAVDNHLKRKLVKLLPAHYLSEESSYSSGPALPVRWVVDPVDGTRNLICGSLDVTISVALVNANGSALIGIVYAPYHDCCYSAAHSFGSFVNNEIIKNHSDQLSQKILSFELPQNAKFMAKDIFQYITKMVESGWLLRQSGSASLDICRVAEGTWSAFYEDQLFSWDVAAAQLIARESNCVVINKITADEDSVVKCMVAKNQHIFDEVCKYISI